MKTSKQMTQKESPSKKEVALKDIYQQIEKPKGMPRSYVDKNGVRHN